MKHVKARKIPVARHLPLLIGIVLVGATAAAAAAAGKQDKVARGEYLISVLGCGDCHTPMKMGERGPEPDVSRVLSGHPAGLQMPMPQPPAMPWGWMGSATNTAFYGPWGITYAPNLTPDEETGIGAWDEALFIRVFRTRKWMGAGRAILPPMPIGPYSHLTDDDLKAMFAYLRTVDPVKNEVPAYAPPKAPSGQSSLEP